MTCTKCNKQPSLPPAAIEIINKCDPVLFHKVLRSANLGDDTAESGTPPSELNYKNVLLVYEANNHAYLYSSDGAYTFISMGELDVDKIMEQLRQLMQDVQNLQETDTQLQAHIDMLSTSLNETNANVADNASNITALSNTVNAQAKEILQNKADIQTNQNAILELQTDLGNEASDRAEADENLQEDINAINTNLNQEVEKDTVFTSDTSTVSVEHTKVNLSTNDTSNITNPLPVASETQAGVMNTATYQAVQNNSENIDAILNGAVALENLSATPTQDELTEAWKTATGKTVLINRASIYDVTNDKVWYYYENINEWKPLTTTGGEVDISVFTNETAGIIKGSENDGQVFAEADGTGSVVGWDGLKHDVENLVELIETNPIPKLYSDYSSATDGANTAAFVNDKLNSQILSLGKNSQVIYPDGGVILGNSAKGGTGVAIGYGATSTIASDSAANVAIGRNAYADTSSGNGISVAIGTSSQARYGGDVAVGAGAVTGRRNEFSIGRTSLSSLYPSTRYIANVTAGVLDTDAVNLGQMNTALETKIDVADIMTVEEFNAAWDAA